MTDLGLGRAGEVSPQSHEGHKAEEVNDQSNNILPILHILFESGIADELAAHSRWRF